MVKADKISHLLGRKKEGRRRKKLEEDEDGLHPWYLVFIKVRKKARLIFIVGSFSSSLSG